MALLASNVDLDLSQLTEDERSLVLEVVRRDRDLRQNELDYIERLQSDVDKLKELSVPENEDKCVRCGVEFWWLFRRSEICETCRRKVCEKCRRPVKDAKANQCWLCVLCYKERELRALTGAWFYQSLKFRRSKRQRKSLRSKPPSAYYPEVSTPPPVEYFYYFNFNDSVAAAKDEVGTDDVDSIWKGSRQLTLDNDSDTLSDISEESETETEESFSVMVDFNGRYNRATRAGLRSDVDKNFAEVAEHNRKLLLQGRRRKVVENPQTFAKIFAEQIVGDMVQMKKDYVQIHLAANGLTPANGNSPQTGRNDMDFDNNDGKSSRNGPALNRRDGSSKTKDEYAPGRRDNEGSTTVHGNGLDIDQKRSSLYVPRAVNGQAQKPKKSVTISSGEPTIAPDPYNIRNQYTSSTSAAPPSNLASCVKVEESPLYSRNIKATMEIPSTPVVVAAVDHDIGMVDDSGPMQSSFKVGENAGVVHDSRVTSSLPPVDLNISQTSKYDNDDMVDIKLDRKFENNYREFTGDQYNSFPTKEDDSPLTTITSKYLIYNTESKNDEQMLPQLNSPIDEHQFSDDATMVSPSKHSHVSPLNTDVEISSPSGGQNRQTLCPVDTDSTSQAIGAFSVAPLRPEEKQQEQVAYSREPEGEDLDDNIVAFNWGSSTECVRVEQGPVYNRVVEIVAPEMMTSTVPEADPNANGIGSELDSGTKITRFDLDHKRHELSLSALPRDRGGILSVSSDGECMLEDLDNHVQMSIPYKPSNSERNFDDVVVAPDYFLPHDSSNDLDNNDNSSLECSGHAVQSLWEKVDSRVVTDQGTDAIRLELEIKPLEYENSVMAMPIDIDYMKNNTSEYAIITRMEVEPATAQVIKQDLTVTQRPVTSIADLDNDAKCVELAPYFECREIRRMEFVTDSFESIEHVLKSKALDDEHAHSDLVEFDWNIPTVGVSVEQELVYEHTVRAGAADFMMSTAPAAAVGVSATTTNALTSTGLLTNDSCTVGSMDSSTDNKNLSSNVDFNGEDPNSLHVVLSHESPTDGFDFIGVVAAPTYHPLVSSFNTLPAVLEEGDSTLEVLNGVDTVPIKMEVKLPNNGDAIQAIPSDIGNLTNNVTEFDWNSISTRVEVDTAAACVVEPYSGVVPTLETTFVEPGTVSKDCKHTTSVLSSEIACTDSLQRDERYSLLMNNSHVDESIDSSTVFGYEDRCGDTGSEQLECSASPTELSKIANVEPVVVSSYENLYTELQMSLLRNPPTDDDIDDHRGISTCLSRDHRADTDCVDNALPGGHRGYKKPPLLVEEYSISSDDVADDVIPLEPDVQREESPSIASELHVDEADNSYDDGHREGSSVCLQVEHHSPAYAHVIESGATMVTTVTDFPDLGEHTSGANAASEYSNLGVGVGASDEDGAREVEYNNISGLHSDRENDWRTSTSHGRASFIADDPSVGGTVQGIFILQAEVQEHAPRSYVYDRATVQAIGYDSSASQRSVTTSDASVTNQTHATVHEPHLLKSDSPIVPAQVAAKVNTRELSASEEQSTQVNSDPAVSELRQVPVAVDSIALETVSVSNVENSSPPFDVNIEEDLMVRSDSPDVRVTETATILAAGAQFADDRSELADDILVQSFDATYIALLPTDHSDFVTKLFDNTSASGDSVIGFQSFDVTSTSPATGDTEVSLELGSEALETENQMPSTDSVFMSPNSASNMQTGYSFELYPQSSLELSTDERGDDLDEAFHSQSSRQTVSLSTEDDHQRIRSTSGMSEKMSWMSDSRDSLSSDLSTATNVKVSGDICLEITYDNRLRVLELRIIECRNLAPIGKTQYANAYVKAYIMPDKNRAGKKKTKVVKKSLNPKFDERMVYDVARAELDDCALWLSVWHSGNFGKNVFLGDVLIPLESYNVDQRQPRWLHLVQQGREKWKSMASLPMKLSPCVKLSLKYVAADSNKSRKTKSTKGELHVSVKEAHGLMSIKNSGVPHAFCKLCLLPEKLSRQHGRHKTATAKRESDPVWNQTFVFPDVNLDDLMSSRSLEITVWDQERLASKSLLGKVVLGSGRDASGQNEDTNMWQSMLNNANEWVEGSVVLQLL